MIARRVGRYELLREIGRGGMATVYLARQTDLARDVALKELTLFDRSDPKLSRRFLREARLAGSLSHPNIVTVHDYVEEDGVPYIAMEYLARGSLRPYVGRLSLAQVGGVLQGVLGGLAHAGERGVVHRDIKPENIMVTAQGSVKIADFGIAKATSAAATIANLTTTGTTLGTPRYMPPERAMGEEVGPWSDLYSVGMMVFELLVGHTPFYDTEVPMAILMRQINDPVPPVSSIVPDVDPAISEWLDRLLAKDPVDRTRSAAIAWSELDGILEHVLGARWLHAAALPASPGDRPARPGPAPSTGEHSLAVTAAPSGAVTLAPSGAVTAAPSRAVTAAPSGAVTVAPSLAMTVAPEAAGPAPRPARKPHRGGRSAVAAAALVIAVVGVLAVALGRHGERPAATVAAGDGELQIAAPAGWREARAGARVRLPLVDPVTVARGAGGSVTAGLMRPEAAANASLLPRDFLESLGLSAGASPARTRVILGDGGVEGWRYAGLRPDGADRPLTVYAVPTTAGVATLACVPPSGGGFDRSCRAIADTLRIVRASTYPLGPNPYVDGQDASESATATPDDSGAAPAAPDAGRARDDSGVGDSRSDDPSDDEPDEEDNGD